ncbi:MAG: hypothetical protein SH817_08625 [Leptospira sp.]|nr:hypothetical protein [Leptospira sp.]
MPTIYEEAYSNGFGGFPFGGLIYSQGAIRINYNLRNDGKTDDDFLSFGIANGSFLESFPIDVQNTIFQKLSFVVNNGGNCQSFKFSLNSLPDVPLLTYTEYALKFGSIPRFKGYITKRPIPGEDEDLNFSGYGFFKKIEKTKIKNPDNHLIQSVSQSGTTMTLNLLPGSLVASAKVGLKIVVKNCNESKNNGVFEITSNGTATIVVLNPSGVTDSSISGVVYILPIEWTESTRIDLLIKKTLSMSLTSSNQVLYDPSTIEETTGFLSAGEVNFEGMEIGKFFDLMRKFLQRKYYIGIDGYGKIFVRQIPLQMIQKLHAGFDFPSGSINTDEEVAGNLITVNKSDSKSGKSSGSSIAGIASDPTSVAKYGEQPYSEDIPGHLSADTGNLYANALLIIMKDPIIQGEAKDMPWRWYDFGLYGYVTKTDFYPFTIEDFDSLTNWVTDAEITRSIVNSKLVNGANSHKLVLTSASENKVHRKPISFRMNSGKNMFFYMFSNVKIKIRYGFGTDSWNENVYDFETFEVDRWFPYRVQFQGLTKQINHIGFQILSDIDAEVYLDFLNCFSYTALHYELQLDQAEYIIDSHERKVTLKFGDLTRNPGFEQYIAGIKAQAEVAKMMVRK